MVTFDDRVITVLREPAALIVSQLNYILTRMFSREDPPSGDTLAWRRTFGVAATGPAADGPPGKSVLLALAARILRNRDVVPANVMTQFLGASRCDIAAERIVTRDIEVTDMERYQAWCRERWQIDSPRRINASDRFLGWDELTSADQELIRGITEQDAALHRMVADRLTVLGRTSLVGRELVGDFWGAPARADRP